MTAQHNKLCFIRWGSGLGRDEKEQITWVEDICNTVFSVNAQRAGQGRHPMTYDDIRKKVRNSFMKS